MDAQVETEMVSKSSEKVSSSESVSSSSKAVVSSQMIKQSSIVSESTGTASAAALAQDAHDLIGEISRLRLVRTGSDDDLGLGGDVEASSSSVSTVASLTKKASSSSMVVTAEESAATMSKQNETEVTVTVKSPKQEAAVEEVDAVLVVAAPKQKPQEDASEKTDAVVVVVPSEQPAGEEEEIVEVVEVEEAGSDGGDKTTTTTTKTVVVVTPEEGSEKSTTTSTTKVTTVTTKSVTKSDGAAEEAAASEEKKPVEVEEVQEVKEEVAEVVKEEKDDKKVEVAVEEEEVEEVEEEEDESEVEEEEEEDDEQEAVVESSDPAKKTAPEVVEVKKVETKAEEPAQPVAEDSVDAKEKPTESAPADEQKKQDNLNNAIKEIISDIDSNIKEDNIAILKQQQLDLLKQQQELAQQIRQQQLLAQQLAAENQMHQQQLQQQKQHQNQQQQQQLPQLQQLPKVYQLPQKNISKYSTFEESNDASGGYSCKSQTYESSESSSNVSKKVDLHKIFTPATDAEEILPKNRKLYSSSAFYSPTLHPTVEDQVELARRISHSLSDTNNKKSKGQSMYVNRKKRSVKWVHEGCGQDIDDNESDIEAEGKENTSEVQSDKQPAYKKLPLRLIMNPRGQMRDIHTDEDAINFATGLLSPDRCAEVVNALQTQKGRGAELFAKRRRKSDKWIVDETNAGTQTPSGLPDYHQYQPKPPTSPSIVPAYSDAGKHRVQLNMQQEQLLEKYAKPGLTVVKTPWEAALETGSASAAFVENRKLSPVPTLPPSVAPQYHDTSNMSRSMPVASGSPYAAEVSPSPYSSSYDNQTQTMSHSQYASHAPRANLQRDLAYKPNVPQGWKAPSVTLPKEYSLNQKTQNIANQNAEAFNEYVKFDQMMDTVYHQQKQQEQLIVQQLFEQQQLEQKHQLQQAQLLQQQHNHQLLYEQQLLEQKQDLQEQWSLKEPQILEQLRRSPELRLSPISMQNLYIYGDAVNELRLRELGPKEQQRKQSLEDHYERVDVRKTLEEFERHQQRLALERQAEERFIRERELRLRRAQSSQKSTKQGDSGSFTMQDQTPNSSQAQAQSDEEDYVKVAVRDLITSFERQTSDQTPEQLKTGQKACFSDVDSLENHDEFMYQDLYIPKEIPLGSYAPPPEVKLPSVAAPKWQPNSQQQQYNQPQQQQQYNQPQQTMPPMSYSPCPVSGQSPQPSYGSGFPVAKTNASGFSSYTPPSQSTYAPPKQPHYAPNSYQRVPQNTSQGAPPVNFNPSPLPYDKLAKFENPEPSQNMYGSYGVPQSHHLSARGGAGSKVRNLSPSPYGGGRGPSSVSPKPMASPVGYSDYSNNSCNSGYSGTPVPAAAPRSPRLSRSDLMHGQTFNNSARGWKSGAAAFPSNGSAAGRPHIQAAHPIPITTSNLPYTDF